MKKTLKTLKKERAKLLLELLNVYISEMFGIAPKASEKLKKDIKESLDDLEKSIKDI